MDKYNLSNTRRARKKLMIQIQIFIYKFLIWILFWIRIRTRIMKWNLRKIFVIIRFPIIKTWWIGNSWWLEIRWWEIFFSNSILWFCSWFWYRSKFRPWILEWIRIWIISFFLCSLNYTYLFILLQLYVYCNFFIAV